MSTNRYCKIPNERRDTIINLVKSIKYFPTGISIIFFNKKARTKAVITDKTIDTTTVSSGSPPNFNNRYETGRFTHYMYRMKTTSNKLITNIL